MRGAQAREIENETLKKIMNQLLLEVLLKEKKREMLEEAKNQRLLGEFEKTTVKLRRTSYSIVNRVLEYMKNRIRHS